jgi:CRISPR/Cas system Type II protein with McrA/HNH and RuvC-like nuclease domain
MRSITDNILRERIFKKSSGKCFYCGKALVLNGGSHRKDYMTCDHLIPRSKGGTAYFHNLVPCCRRCNNIKGDTKSIEQFRFELSMDHFQKKYRIRFTQKHLDFLHKVLNVKIPVRMFVFHFENSKDLMILAKPLLELEVRNDEVQMQ